MESLKDAVTDLNKTDSDKRNQTGVKRFDGMSQERLGRDIKFSGSRSRIWYLLVGVVFLVVASFIAGLFIGRLTHPHDETGEDPTLMCSMNGNVLGRIILFHNRRYQTLQTEVEGKSMLFTKHTLNEMKLYLSKTNSLLNCSMVDESDADRFTPTIFSSPSPFSGQLATFRRSKSFYEKLEEIPAHLKMHILSFHPEEYVNGTIVPEHRNAVHFQEDLKSLVGRMLMMISSDGKRGNHSACCILSDPLPDPES